MNTVIGQDKILAHEEQKIDTILEPSQKDNTEKNDVIDHQMSDSNVEDSNNDQNAENSNQLAQELNQIEPASQETNSQTQSSNSSSPLEEEDDDGGLSRYDSFIDNFRFDGLDHIGPLGPTGLKFPEFNTAIFQAINSNILINNFSFPRLARNFFINEDALTQNPTSNPTQRFADENKTDNSANAPRQDNEPDVETPSEPSPPQQVENLGAVQIFSKVSDETTNQSIINNNDHYDLDLVKYKKGTKVNGETMDIAGVRDDAQIVYKYKNANTFQARLKSNWNSVKNIEVDSEAAAKITLNNFVHTDVTLGGGGNSKVVIRDAKRGNIETGDGDDVIHVRAESNGSGWSNTFNIDSGDGSDKIILRGDDGHTIFNIDSGSGNDRVVTKGDYNNADIDLGAGDDIFRGGRHDDVITGGAGNDHIRAGRDNDVLYGDNTALPTISIAQTDVTYEWIASKAGYKNTLGHYIVDEDGTIQGVEIIYANMKGADKSDQSFTFDGGENLNLQSFIIANGYNQNKSYNGLDMDGNHLSFIYNYGQADERAANISDNARSVSLVYDDGETAKVLKGNVYHQTQSLNRDGKDHVIEEMIDGDTQELGFEDLYNLGDRDFQDVVTHVTTEHDYSFAYDAIEGGNDKLYGGHGDDLIIGGAGDDILHGGSGFDIAFFMGGMDEYTISRQGGKYTVEDSIDGRDGTDILRGIDGILFGTEDLFLNIIETMSDADLQNAFGIDSTDDLDLSMIVEDYDVVSQAIQNFVSVAQSDQAHTETLAGLSDFLIVAPREALDIQEQAVL